MMVHATTSITAPCSPLSPTSGGKFFLKKANDSSHSLHDCGNGKLFLYQRHYRWTSGLLVGRRMKDKDIKRGRGATRGQRGPMLKGHRGSYFSRDSESAREQRVARKKTKAYGLIFEKVHCLHTRQLKMQGTETETTLEIKSTPHLSQI